MNKLFRVYSLFNKYRIILSFIPAISGIWYTIVKFFGTSLNWYKTDGTLIITISIITWICIICSIIYILSNVIFSFVNKKINKQGYDVLHEVISSYNSIYEKRIDTTLEIFEKNKSIQSSFWILTNPLFSELIKELNICLHKITNIKRENIGISVIGKYDFEDKWKFICKTHINGTSFDKLIKNKNSSVRQIIDGKSDFLFFPNKKNAFENGTYFPNNKDFEYSMQGSIICKKLDITLQNKCRISAILNITTYNNQICNDIETEKEKIKNLIISPFELKLKYALCLDYLAKSNRNKINENKKKSSSLLKPVQA